MSITQRGTLWELLVDAKKLLEDGNCPLSHEEGEEGDWQIERDNWIKRFEEAEKGEASEREGYKPAFYQRAYRGNPAEDAEAVRGADGQ